MKGRTFWMKSYLPWMSSTREGREASRTTLLPMEATVTPSSAAFEQRLRAWGRIGSLEAVLRRWAGAEDGGTGAFVLAMTGFVQHKRAFVKNGSPRV